MKALCSLSCCSVSSLLRIFLVFVGIAVGLVGRMGVVWATVVMSLTMVVAC